jgi:hypothetical protein
MDFPRLGKLSLPAVPEPEDVVQCGSLEYYDKAYDRCEFILEKLYVSETVYIDFFYLLFPKLIALLLRVLDIRRYLIYIVL